MLKKWDLGKTRCDFFIIHDFQDKYTIYSEPSYYNIHYLDVRYYKPISNRNNILGRFKDTVWYNKAHGYFEGYNTRMYVDMLNMLLIVSEEKA